MISSSTNIRFGRRLKIDCFICQMHEKFMFNSFFSPILSMKYNNICLTQIFCSHIVNVIKCLNEKKKIESPQMLLKLLSIHSRMWSSCSRLTSTSESAWNEKVALDEMQYAKMTKSRACESDEKRKSMRKLPANRSIN